MMNFLRLVAIGLLVGSVLIGGLILFVDPDRSSSAASAAPVSAPAAAQHVPLPSLQRFIPTASEFNDYA